MGEFNVNKSDGSLNQTAGMPDTYPATQVMMPDGVTSVEERISASSLDNRTAITGDFVVPSDGYISAVAGAAGDYVSCRIYGSNTLTDNVVVIGVGYQSGFGANAFYVKKGMRISYTNIVAGGKLWFVPFM
jgi:hypothetical protein